MLVIHFMIVSLSATSDSSANLQEPRTVTISTGLLTCIFNKKSSRAFDVEKIMRNYQLHAISLV